MCCCFTELAEKVANSDQLLHIKSMGSEGESSGMKPNLPWARLVSCNMMHKDMEIKEDDVTFDSSDMGLHSNVTINSCRICRNVDLGIVKLQNLSSSEMLIDGQLLGKDEQIVLENGNEIIFGSERNGHPIYHFNLICGDQHGKLSEKVSLLVDNLKCSICLNIWCDVVSITPCLHNFCNSCFSEWYKRSGEKGIKCICPQCRSDIYSVGRNHSLRNIVEDMLKDNPSLQRSAKESSQLDNAIVQSDIMIFDHKRPFHMSAPFTESSDSDDESFNNGMGAQCPQCIPLQGSVGEGFHCVRETVHLTCQSCWGLMPLRTDISVPQMCLGCRKVLCKAYWDSQNALNDGSHFNVQCNNDAVLPISRHIFSEVPEQTHGGNTIEQDITRRCIHDQGKTVSEVVQEWNLKLDAGEIDQPRLPANPIGQITSATPLCNSCAKVVIAHILHWFRLSVPKNELPRDAAGREDCWWGHGCRTQHHRVHHAQMLNHVCDPIRRPRQ
ncbi:uncharacterized protein LOC131032724 isoform X2 [Cryptomeria japonica]|uniref:uncharacterized protein LOC131032724 isoform X2 n=1 Tax=Cryptomeria japonica TaxID=3369 RepID=UPI0027DA9711|nr:uncharacterized protein LOC131032724 isoform X2 [Cryptomeria japonica]